MSSNQPYQSPQDKDEVPPCCQKCSTGMRKLGFYLTLLIGAVLYLVAILNFFSSVFGGELSYMYAVSAALVTLFCPLWMKSFSQVLSGLREPSRKSTFFCLLISLVGLLLSGYMDKKFPALIFILGNILFGLFLALSYYQGGQESLIDYLKKCFGKGGNNNNFNQGNNNV